MKYILLLLVSTILFVSCGKKLEVEVTNTYPDGTTMKENYYQYQGNTPQLVKEITYFPDGSKQLEGEWKDGKKNGKWTYWYQKDVKWMEENYQSDIRHGETKVWYISGEINYEGMYESGLPDGKWIFRNEKGDKISETIYKNGKKISSKKY